jgi:uncharacterized protein YaaN involved in tellurite resistance
LGSYDEENEGEAYEDEEGAEEDLIEAIVSGTASLEQVTCQKKKKKTKEEEEEAEFLFLQLLDSDLFVNALSERSPDIMEFLKVDNHTEKLIELVVSPEMLNLNPVAGEVVEIPAEVQAQRRHA